MHALQPKHSKLKQEEIDKLLQSLNISIKQLPKIKISDPALPENTKENDIIRIERMETGKKADYYRLVVRD